MKHLFTILFTVSSVFSGALIAQRTVEIPNEPTAPTDIVAFIEEDQADEAYDPSTIYLLANEGLFFMNSRLTNPDYTIRIHAKDTANKALKPLITREKADAGTYPGNFRPENDVELVNLEIRWGENDPGADHAWGIFRLSRDSIKLTLIDCIMEKDRGGLPQVRANGCKIYAENTIWRSLGNRRISQGNGRGIDARNFWMDSVIVKNCVFHNVQDRVFRSQGATIPHNYIEFDQNTIFNQTGRHGLFQFGFGAKTVKVTNNIIQNPIMFGVTQVYNDEQFQEDDTNKFVFTIDGDQNRVDSIGTNFTFDNNNIFWNQDLLDYYASNDTVSQAGIMSQEIVRRLGGQSNADTTYFAETLAFNTVPVSLLQYVKDVYADPSATDMFDLIVEPSSRASTFPDIFGDYENLFDFSTFDIGYDTESASFTAATDGGSVGARFGNFGLPVDSPLSASSGYVATFMVYPNPVQGPATFRYSVEQPGEVAITITDINGRNLGTMERGFKSSGTHDISVDLSNYITSHGVYFAKFQSEGHTKVMRLVYINR